MDKSYFSLSEFFHNCLYREIVVAMKDKDISDNICNLRWKLNDLRSTFGKPIKINSGYRDFEHNKRVGGSVTSQHMRGQAADIAPNDWSKELFPLFREVLVHSLDFGQIIIYDRFIHVALKNPRYTSATLSFNSRNIFFTKDKYKDFVESFNVNVI